MSDMKGHRPWRSFRLFGLLVLLISISCAGQCGRDDDPSDPPRVERRGRVQRGGGRSTNERERPPEIIVELKESDRRVTPSPTHGDSLLYGPVPLRQIFAGRVTDLDQIELRQSFPRFSKRWQRDREWRTGRTGRSDDSLAIAVIEGQILDCGSMKDQDQMAVRQFIMNWRQDQDIVRSNPDGVPSLIRLLNHQPGRTDSAIASAFINRLADGGEKGQDSLAIPAIHRGIEICRIEGADKMAVLRFTRRLSKGGAPRAVSTPAMRAALDLTRGRAISFHDSLALSSWIGRLAGSDLPAQPGATSVQPPAVDLFLRVRIKNTEVDTERLLKELSSIPEVKQVTRALPVSKTPPSGAALGFSWPGSPSAALAQAQPANYLQPAPKGVGSDAVWSLPGGTGENVRLIVCDEAFWRGHEDFPATIANETPDIVAPGFNELQHGTLSLGVLLAQHNAIGVNGMCPAPREARFYSYLQSQAQSDSSIDALTAALDSLTTVVSDSEAGGYVLLLEAQLDLNSTTVCNCTRPAQVPVEANPDYFSAIAHLVEYYDVIVVEPAGNGAGMLCSLSNSSGVFWNPDDASNNSGAIMVGAGVPGEGTGGTPLSRMASSNYGDRVDCQGWGRLVQSTSFNYDASDTVSAYAEHMETSGASAVVTGVIACIQSTHFAAHDWYLSPAELREILRGDANNTAQPTSSQRIGPLPNLDLLLVALCVSPPCADWP